MKQKILILLALVTCLCVMTSCYGKIPVPHKYAYGDKILLKTGDIAVIVEYPYGNRTYLKGDPQPMPRYVIRVSFVKRLDITDSLLDGIRHHQTEINKFTVFEHEIEKKIVE